MRRLLLLVPLLLAGCVEQHIAEGRVQSALVNSGVRPAVAHCMAAHMVDKLTIAQLRKLQTLQGPGKRSTADYLIAVKRINDPQVVRVSVAAAALCMTGWEH